MSNLPQYIPSQSGKNTVEFFDQYFVKKISFPADEVDAVVGFFVKRGFQKLSATSIATVLLTQAKLDNVKVFKLLDTLEGTNSLQLNAVVSEILNYNRQKISTLGYKTPSENTNEERNIVYGVPTHTVDGATSYMEDGYVDPNYVE